MNRKLTTQEMKDLNNLRALQLKTAPAEISEPLYNYIVHLAGQEHPIHSAMTETRANANLSRGFMQVGERHYTIKSIVKASDEPI